MSYCYKKITLPDGSKMDEHRFVMEQHLGHRLNKNQIVHHINGNKRDNRFENLEVMTRRQHAQFHLTGVKQTAQMCASKSAAHIGKPQYGTRRVSDEQIRKALHMYSSGERNRDIERQCGLSMGTLYPMINHKCARHLDFTVEILKARQRYQKNG